MDPTKPREETCAHIAAPQHPDIYALIGRHAVLSSALHLTTGADFDRARDELKAIEADLFALTDPEVILYRLNEADNFLSAMPKEEDGQIQEDAGFASSVLDSVRETLARAIIRKEGAEHG